MKFLLDENFPKAAAELLQRLGHECRDLRGTDFEGSADEVLVKQAQESGEVILTTDRDFFHTLPRRFPGHAGVVVVALKQPNRAAILERLEWLLLNVPTDQLRGRAIQLRDHHWVAQPPIQKESDD